MLFSCPTRRAKHAKKSAAISDWMSDDDQSLSQYSIASNLAAQRTRKAVVLQTYTAQLANEMSVQEGEIIHIVHHAKNWAYVINSEGQKGYIPYSYCGDTSNTLPRQGSRRSHLANRDNTDNGHQTGSQRWSNQPRPNGAADQRQRRKYDDTYSLYSECMDMLDLAETMSIRSSVDPEIGTRLGMGVYMADILPFFRVPYGRSVVLFDFRGDEENDLHVVRGTEVVVLNQDDPGWIWVRTDDKQEGFVPRTYICQCGCTSIHEQIVESLQATMQKQEEQHFERERQRHRQQVQEGIPEEEEEDNLVEYPEYDYARFQGQHRIQPIETGSNGTQEVQYSVQKEAEAFDPTGNVSKGYTYATVIPKSERQSKAVFPPDGDWGDQDANHHVERDDIRLKIVSDVSGPADVNYLDLAINDNVYITEENLEIGKGSGWLFVYSPDLDRYGYVPEKSVQSM